ncbi:MAG TPA: M28 family peptidase [Clostridia bacterium]|jgi:hypothetical protein|nr:M28 family peptidase [Clostridia bacterium]
MKKKLAITFSIVLIISCTIGVFSYLILKNLPNWGSINKKSPLQTERIENQNDNHNIIAQLAKLKGRAAGTKYEKEAATLIAREFVNLDLEPLPNNTNFYFQTFKVPQSESYISGERLRFRGQGPPVLSSQNVFGFLPGTNKDKVLIFTAHYDGQGINNNEIYESANDNLSGVYVLLKVAQALKDRPKRNLSYLFVAFGSEEIGLYGSEFFLQNLPIRSDTILGVINCDTVSSEKEVMILQAFTKNPLVAKVEEALTNYNFRVKLELSKLRTSDHYHFSAAGLDALTIAAADWLEGNHTPQDTYEKLNFKILDQLGKALVDMALTMDEHTMY